jgi:hypothetical protein
MITNFISRFSSIYFFTLFPLHPSNRYVFAFYKFKDTQLKTERNCFEHHQGILEGLTENLSKICETNLNLETTSTISTANSNNKESESPESISMDDIIQDIANQTRSIKVFTENVLGYVDNGLQL